MFRSNGLRYGHVNYHGSSFYTIARLLLLALFSGVLLSQTTVSTSTESSSARASAVPSKSASATMFESLSKSPRFSSSSSVLPALSRSTSQSSRNSQRNSGSGSSSISARVSITNAASRSPSVTPSNSRSALTSSTVSGSSLSSPSVLVSRSPSVSLSVSPTSSESHSVSVSGLMSRTTSGSVSTTRSASFSSLSSDSKSAHASHSQNASRTNVESACSSMSAAATDSSTITATNTPSPSQTPSVTPTGTSSVTITPTKTSSQTASPSPLFCSPGFYLPLNSYTCTQCPLGLVSTTFGASQCEPCLPGLIPFTNATGCTQCGLGNFSTFGSSNCTECPAGTIASSTGTIRCENCPPGTSPTQNRTSCSFCAPGNFSSAGVSCTKCALGTVSIGYGSDRCDTCATVSGFAPHPNQTQCILCPFATFSTSLECSTCPIGSYCNGLSNDICIPPSACLGNGCALGYAQGLNYMCGKCDKQYFRSASGCTLCSGASPWYALVVLMAGLACAAIPLYLFREALLPVMNEFARTAEDHRLEFILLGDQAIRLILLNRLSALPLPTTFKWALSYIGLLLGLNTASSGAECSGIPWSFSHSYAVIAGSISFLSFLTFFLDLYFYRPLQVSVAQYRIWDALEVLLPLIVQISWEALTYVTISQVKWLYSEVGITLWDAWPHRGIVIASVIFIAADLSFIFFRYITPCVKCKVNVATSQKSRRFLTTEPAREGRMRTVVSGDDKLSIFNAWRSSLSFLRSIAIYLQQYGGLIAGIWLITVSFAELLVIAIARVELATNNGRALYLGLFLVFFVTHVAGVTCLLAPGGCANLDVLGYFLILFNLGFFIYVSYEPCRRIALSFKAEAELDANGNVQRQSRRSYTLGQTKEGLYVVRLLAKIVTTPLDPRKEEDNKETAVSPAFTNNNNNINRVIGGRASGSGQLSVRHLNIISPLFTHARRGGGSKTHTIKWRKVIEGDLIWFENVDDPSAESKWVLDDDDEIVESVQENGSGKEALAASRWEKIVTEGEETYYQNVDDPSIESKYELDIGDVLVTLPSPLSKAPTSSRSLLRSSLRLPSSRLMIPSMQSRRSVAFASDSPINPTPIATTTIPLPALPLHSLKPTASSRRLKIGIEKPIKSNSSKWIYVTEDSQSWYECISDPSAASKWDLSDDDELVEAPTPTPLPSSSSSKPSRRNLMIKPLVNKWRKVVGDDGQIWYENENEGDPLAEGKWTLEAGDVLVK